MCFFVWGKGTPKANTGNKLYPPAEGTVAEPMKPHEAACEEAMVDVTSVRQVMPMAHCAENKPGQLKQ
jgi:hypothetical protein